MGESIVRIGLGAITAIRGSLLRGAPHLQGKESGNHKKSTQLAQCSFSLYTVLKGTITEIREGQESETLRLVTRVC